MRRSAVVCLIAGCLTVAGCTKVPTRAATTPVPSATAAPVDPTQAPAGSAERAVLELIGDVQSDGAPLALDYYDPRVITALGSRTIIAGLASQAPALKGALISKVSEASRSAGRFVVRFRLTPLRGAPTTQVFALVRRDEDWKVIYDTFLAGGLLYAGRDTGRGQENLRRYFHVYQQLLPLGEQISPFTAPPGD